MNESRTKTTVAVRTSQPVTLATDFDNSDLPPHLLPVVEGQWAIWCLAGLRGAGFPADQVLKLAASECAATADELIRAEEEVGVAADALRASLDNDLDTLRRDGLWHDKSKRGLLLDALHQLKTDRVPERLDYSTATATALSRYRDNRARLDSLSSINGEMFEAASKNLSQTIYEMASSKQLQEAIVWQNHHAWQSAVKGLLRNPPNTVARTSKRRQQEELIASYLQRYCVKNDTIGFFGPVGWARFVPAGEPLTLRPGSGLLAARNVYFEGWAIDTLAATLAKDKAIRPWLAPRRMPFVHVEQEIMILPGSSSVRLQPLRLTPDQAVILQACDGQRPAKLLAADLIGAGVLGVKSEEEIYRILDMFCNWGVVVWTLEVPLQLRAEQTLRQLIEGIGEQRLRQLGLNALGELEAARDCVAAAAGDPEKLDRELNTLEEKFSRLTGASATRGAGQVYAARMLVYEDCRRDIEVEIGKEVLIALAPGLSLLLTSVRWLTYEVARMYRKAFRSIYAGLVAKSGSKVVSASDFWIKCDPIFHKDDMRIADQVIPTFQSMWANVLSLPAGARRVNFTYEQLRSRVETTFRAPCPGWSLARHASPDVMIAACGPEAIRRGDFHLVLGEVHLGVNSLMSSLFVGQHPKPEEIHKAFTADFTQPRLSPVPTKNWHHLTTRTHCEFIVPTDYQLMVSVDACGVTPSRALPISSLVVEDCDGQLMLRTRDNRLRFEIVEGLGQILSYLVLHSFSILPLMQHSPRITVDRLTISRETWQFPPAEISFAYEADEAKRFLGARRWVREFDLPRFVFIKSPVEEKPFYVDFDSPILVNLLARIIRRTKESNNPESLITVSEMLPAHGELWLLDAEQQLYTSELRLVTVDRQPFGSNGTLSGNP